MHGWPGLRRRCYLHRPETPSEASNNVIVTREAQTICSYLHVFDNMEAILTASGYLSYLMICKWLRKIVSKQLHAESGMFALATFYGVSLTLAGAAGPRNDTIMHASIQTINSIVDMSRCMKVMDAHGEESGL